MKIILSMLLLTACASGSAWAQDKAPTQSKSNRGLDVVPLTAWPNRVLWQMAQIGQITGYRYSPNLPRTRYGFAVAMMRWMQEHGHDADSLESLKAKDLATALGYEIAWLNTEDPMHIAEPRLWLERKRDELPSDEWFEFWRGQADGTIKVPPPLHYKAKDRVLQPPRLLFPQTVSSK